MAENFDLQKWLNERNNALINLDMDYARKTMPDAEDDEIRLLAMHKARYECTHISDELRNESLKFLRQGNYKRCTGDELLPEGSLPTGA